MATGDSSMKLAANLLSICKKRGLSLAKLSRMCGVPIQTLHGWSTGKSVANLEQLKKVASSLEVSLYELAFGETDPFENKSEEILKELFSGDVRVTLHKIERRRK
jgi:transcriptional regulator with XRE-family HTH domain